MLVIFDELLAKKKLSIDVQKSRRSISVLAGFCQDLPLPLDVDLALRRGSSLKKISGTMVFDESSSVLFVDRLGVSAPDVRDEPYEPQVALQAKTKPLIEYDLFWDEWQIYDARCRGIDSVTVWAGLMDEVSMQYLIEVSRELHMEPFLIAQDAAQLEQVLKTDARLIQLGSNFFEMSDKQKTSITDLRALMKKARQNTAHHRVYIAGVSGSFSEDDLYEMGFSAKIISPSFTHNTLLSEIHIHV